MEMSNTAALDRLGWRGICIDPFLKKAGFLQRTCRLSQHAVRHLSLPCLLRLSSSFQYLLDLRGLNVSVSLFRSSSMPICPGDLSWGPYSGIEQLS